MKLQDEFTISNRTSQRSRGAGWFVGQTHADTWLPHVGIVNCTQQCLPSMLQVHGPRECAMVSVTLQEHNQLHRNYGPETINTSSVITELLKLKVYL